MSEIYPTLVNVLPSDTFEQWRIKTNSVMNHAEAGAVNLGNVNFLTTDAKTSAVDAINEVNSHSDQNSILIGNLNFGRGGGGGQSVHGGSSGGMLKPLGILTLCGPHY